MCVRPLIGGSANKLDFAKQNLRLNEDHLCLFFTQTMRNFTLKTIAESWNPADWNYTGESSAGGIVKLQHVFKRGHILILHHLVFGESAQRDPLAIPPSSLWFSGGLFTHKSNHFLSGPNHLTIFRARSFRAKRFFTYVVPQEFLPLKVLSRDSSDLSLRSLNSWGADKSVN